MFEITYNCSIEYKNLVEQFIFLWKTDIETIETKTSGSTGEPKTISLKRSQILASIESTKIALELQPNFKTLCNLDINTIAGKMMILRAIEIGMKIWIVEPSKNPFEKINSKIVFDFLSLVPLQLEYLIDFEKKRLKTAKVIIIGGAAINPNLENKLLNFPCKIFGTYGMTETVTHIALRRIDLGIKSFTILPNVEIKSSSNKTLQIKAPNTDNQWITTNDFVQIKGGNFDLIGRIDNIINSGGVKIQLEKIEIEIQKNVANRFFCWGIEDEKLGQKLVVFSEGQEIDLIEMQQNLVNLSKFELPKAVFIIEKFVETASQKIDKIKTVNAYFNNSVSKS